MKLKHGNLFKKEKIGQKIFKKLNLKIRKIQKNNI
jgi:hypothetical protein